MSARLHTSDDVDLDYLQHPLLLAVVGGLHVFRALEHMRQVAFDAESSSSSRLEPCSSLRSSASVTVPPSLGQAAQTNCSGSCAHIAAAHRSEVASEPGPSSISQLGLHSDTRFRSVFEYARDPLSSQGSRLAALHAEAQTHHHHQNQQWETIAASTTVMLSSATHWQPRTGRPAALPHHHHHRHQLHDLLSGISGAIQRRNKDGADAKRFAAEDGAAVTCDAARGPILVLPQRRHGSDRQAARGGDALATGGRDPDGMPGWLQAATAAAGAASRTLAQVAIHPLDTLKTRLQVSSGGAPALRLWRAVMSCPACRPRALAAWAGPAGLRDVFLGLGAAVGGTLPASALYFGAEAAVRGWVAQAASLDRESAPCRLVASAAAATLSALIRVPADVIKHRVQAYAYPSSAAAARHILATRGPAGLYAGFGATLLRDAPEIVIQFTVYRQLKSLMAQLAPPPAAAEPASAGGGGGSAAEHMLLGGAAGAAAALATTPLDVVKTQLQCGAAGSVGGALRGVLAAGGPRALFRGLAPRLAQTTLCSALFFAAFEASKAQLGLVASAAAQPSSSSAGSDAAVAVAALLAPVPAAALSAAGVAGSSNGVAPPPAPCWGDALSSPGHRRRRSGGSAEFGAVRSGANPLAAVAEYSYAYARAAAPRSQLPGAGVAAAAAEPGLA